MLLCMWSAAGEEKVTRCLLCRPLNGARMLTPTLGARSEHTAAELQAPFVSCALLRRSILTNLYKCCLFFVHSERQDTLSRQRTLLCFCLVTACMTSLLKNKLPFSQALSLTRAAAGAVPTQTLWLGAGRQVQLPAVS